jgi:hypothetical protein
MTVKAARIRVEVGPAELTFERAATFTTEGKLHAIIVDAQDLHRDLLRVDVVREAGDDLVIELPRPTISGRLLTVPRGQVFAEPLSPEGYVHRALALLLGGIVVVATIAFLILHDLI